MLTYLQKIVVILKVIFIFVLNKEIGMLYMYNGINKSVETRIIQELTCFQRVSHIVPGKLVLRQESATKRNNTSKPTYSKTIHDPCLTTSSNIT